MHVKNTYGKKSLYYGDGGRIFIIPDKFDKLITSLGTFIVDTSRTVT